MSFILNPYVFAASSGGPPTFVGGTSGSFTDGGGGSISLTGLTGGIASAPSQNDIVIVVVLLGTKYARNVSLSFGTFIAQLFSDDSFDYHFDV